MNPWRTRAANNQRLTTMKTSLLIAITTLTSGLASQAFAGDVLLSARAALLAHEFRKVPSAAVDPNLVGNIQHGSAKARQLAYELRKVPGTGRDIDLAHAPRPTLSPKDPRYEVVLRENAMHAFQVAPMK